MAIFTETVHRTTDPFEALYLIQADGKALKGQAANVELEKGKFATVWTFANSDAIRRALEAKTKTIEVTTASAGLRELGVTLVLPGVEEPETGGARGARRTRGVRRRKADKPSVPLETALLEVIKQYPKGGTRDQIKNALNDAGYSTMGRWAHNPKIVKLILMSEKLSAKKPGR